MKIDPMENELDYPAKYNKKYEPDLCPKCGKEVKFDSWGVWCSCGYKEPLLEGKK